MDIIVVKYPDETFKSTSFHVRFGSLKILKPQQKIVINVNIIWKVKILVNGQPTELTMKLSSSGDGYFIPDVKFKLPNNNVSNNSLFYSDDSDDCKIYNNSTNNSPNFVNRMIYKMDVADAVSDESKII